LDLSFTNRLSHPCMSEYIFEKQESRVVEPKRTMNVGFDSRPKKLQKEYLITRDEMYIAGKDSRGSLKVTDLMSKIKK